MSMMATSRPCTFCGSGQVGPGFFDDKGDGTAGYVRWIAGPLQRGFLGVKKSGRQRMAVEAWRCDSCGHLELFAVKEP